MTCRRRNRIKSEVPSAAVDNILAVPSFGEKNALFVKIRDLQASGRFPPCQLQDVTTVSSSSVSSSLTDRPLLLEPSECWDDSVSNLTVWHAFRMSIESKHKFDVLEDGVRVKQGETARELDSCNLAVTAALVQCLGEPSDFAELEPHSLMEVPLPESLWHLRPDLHLRNTLHILEDCHLPLRANCTSAGTFADLNIDYNHCRLSLPIGGSCAIWLLYPPTEANLRHFYTARNESSRLSMISQRLEGGYAVELDASKVLYIPPGWIHCTFTAKGGLLLNSNFVAIEHLARVSQHC
ncbi:hypothetical protein LOZ66_001773 [Ophidiomyces ophidiicola]|nr:hypothetical protein LOZ66_001773 [Ophidiomyces ophidiicola]